MECSFCGKTDGAVKLILRGPAACICNECVKICKEIVEHENKKEQTASMENQNPIDIRREYTTRDGGKVRLLCDDGPIDTPVVAIVGYGPTISSVVQYTREGRVTSNGPSPLDLVEVRKKFRRELWANVYLDSESTNVRFELTSTEISLAFAREVAGYPEGLKLKLYWHPDFIPDYANDWSATIAVLKAKGLKFQILEESCIVEEKEAESHYLDIYKEDVPEPAYGEQERAGDDYYTPHALCLAAIKCVRGSKG